MPIQFRRKLRAIQFRLQWIEFCRKGLVTLGVASVGLSAYVLASRLIPMDFGPEEALPWVGGSAAVWLASWIWFRRVRLFDAALRADEWLGLKERLSSAYMIRQPKSEAEAAVIEDALSCAATILPMRQFPARLGRELKWAAPPVVALILLWWLMPQFDLLAGFEKKKETLALEEKVKKEAAKELDELAREVAENAELKKSELAERAEKDIKELARQIEEQKIGTEQAMAKLAKLSDKLSERQGELQKQLSQIEKLRTGKGEDKEKESGKGGESKDEAREGEESKGEDGKQGEAGKPGEASEKKERPGGEEMTKEISKSLEMGNFAKAAEAMEKLQKKLQNGELSEEQKKQLAKELSKLGEKLGKESKLGESLKQASQKMADGKTTESMADMEMAAMSMKDMESAMKELASLESMKSELDAHKKALSGKPGECKSCGAATKPGKSECASCEAKGGAGKRDGAMNGGSGKSGAWKPGDSSKQGQGMGGAGIGQGGTAQKKEGPTAFEKTKINGDVGAGKIIAKMKVEGAQNTGEVKTQYEAMRLEYEQKAEDSLKNEVMPLEHKAMIRKYFDAIREGKPGVEEK